ncbi:TIGR04076 family protein [Aspergillus stella-maris]|uniref:TIGR04076 family protein n=1 Tax=Aspergillus stella-maris TaxID=1810926 RepID=UPI003CCDBF75
MAADDTFTLYDLRVEVIVPEGKRILCGAKPGDFFTLQGEMMYLPEGQGISIYSLASKQRATHPNDWMSTDAIIACPDPHCPSQLRIVRTRLREFRHGDTTVVPLVKESEMGES